MWQQTQIHCSVFMLRPPHISRLRTAAIACILAAVFTGPLFGQQADGFTLQQRPGIALIKPQAWSKPSDATVTEFVAFIDRTADGGSGAGYFELRTKQGFKKQVGLAKVVKLIVYPDPDQMKEIVQPEDRKALQISIDEIMGVIATYPATKTYLEPPLKKMTAETAQFDAGKVKTDGQWIARQDYDKNQALKLLGLLNADISRADPPGSFDLDNDPKFIALKKFSTANPSIKAQTEALAAAYGKTLRFEKRKAILARLTDPSSGMPAAQKAVTQLKALNPEEDPRSTAFVKAWDAGSVTVKDLAAQATKLAASLEEEMGSVQTEGTPPQLSPELDKDVSALNEKTALFVASQPPPQFITECKQAQAVCAMGTDFKKLNQIFQEKQFLVAKDILDNLSRQSANIGPQTSRVITVLQSFAATKIDEFTRLREEAKLLADSGKNAEALAKYQDAYSVIPDTAVDDEITKLKPPEPPAPPR
jgi:hypothetical protein